MENWNEPALHDNTRAGAFFTLLELANDFKLEVPGRNSLAFVQGCLATRAGPPAGARTRTPTKGAGEVPTTHAEFPLRETKRHRPNPESRRSPGASQTVRF